MPYKANEARRHKIPRARFRVRNWPEYDRALQQRGSLTVWVTPEALAAWHPPKTGRRGRSRTYSDIAIETGHLLRLAFGRPWRQTEGLLRSLATLLGLDIGVPDHTTFSRRSPGLALAGSLAQGRWCTDTGEQTALAPPGPWYQATRVETGFATRIMRLSTSAATAASPCWAGKRRARSFGPMIALYLPTAVSARLRRP